MHKSSLYLTLTSIGILLLIALIGLHPLLNRPVAAHRLAVERDLVRKLGLTDICLFSEASYLRHPNLADRFVPFQDHPMAVSHFPSESLLPPPRHLVKTRTAALRRSSP